MGDFWAHVFWIACRPLYCIVRSLSPFLARVGFISLELITPMAYLGSWALVAPITNARVFLDLHPFLLEVIDAIHSNIFPFLTHLKSTQKLFPLHVVACVPPFM
jgi:hypothetical protein